MSDWQNMEHSYQPIKRIEVEGFKARGKDYLTHEEVAELLSDTFYIEEKLDGKTGGFRLPPYVFWYEELKYLHTIPYTKLPTWRIIFDVWNIKTQTLLNHEEKTKLLQDSGYGRFQAPLFDYMVTTFTVSAESLAQKWLTKLSAFGEHVIEGIVIKNYEKMLMGKIVNPAFEEAVDAGTHPMRRKKVMNRLQV